MEDRLLLSVMTLNPVKDNTIYSESENSNGLGERMDVGNNNNGFSRRALVAFDVAGNVPAGSTINSVTLDLYLFNNPSGATAPIELHRLEADWGEGSSSAGGGSGGTATTGDATWTYAFYDTVAWTMQGGDFSDTASDTIDVGPDTGVFYTWGSTADMVADVQAWLNDSSTNFGWLLKGDETATSSNIKGFRTKDDSAGNFPVLTIDYTEGSQAPTVAAPIDDLTAGEDDAPVLDHADLNAVFDDADTPDADLVYTVQANTPGGIVVATIDTDDTLDLSFVADQNGTVDITVRATDPEGNFAEDTFTVTVDPVNDAPSFTAGPDQTVKEGTGAQTVSTWATDISAGPADEAGQTLTFNVTNDNNALFAVQPAIDASSGDLTYTLAASGTGEATVTVELQDDGGTDNGGVDTSAAQMFKITVTAGDVPPTVANPIDDLTVDEDAASVLDYADLNNVFDDADTDDADLVYTIESNTGSTVVVVTIEADDTLDLSFVAEEYGSANITVRATDPEGNFAEDTFTVTVNSVNDAPSFTGGADEKVLEDAGAQTVAGWATGMSAGPANESTQVLTFVVTNDNNGLFSAQPAVDPATGDLTYTPAANANGVATVSVQLMDDGGTAGGGVDTSAVQMFTITVTAVNDAPSFNKGPNQVVSQDAGAQSAASWAKNISAGPADEAGQTLTFLVTNDNNALFSVQPAIDPTTGELTYTPAADGDGTALVSVQLMDDGGTDNGGMDTSSVQTFTILVTPYAVASLHPLKDNTIYGNNENSNALGPRIDVGLNNGLATRRGLIAFDVAAAVPAGAKIHGATLNLFLFNNSSSDISAIELHRLSADWGEGTSNASGGSGAAATTDDATRTFAFFNTIAWATVGGDFDSAVSASADVGPDIDIFYTWGSAAQMVADVQAWLDDPGSNFGWMILGDESAGSGNVKGFRSKDFGDASVHPLLTIIYSEPPAVASPIADLTVNEDDPPVLDHADLNAVFDDPDTDDADLMYTVEMNTPGGIVVATIDTDDTLDLSFVADQNGPVDITVRATDPEGNFAENTFTVTVNPVNDAPSFTAGPDDTVAQDSGARTLPGWATNISAGPADESGQVLTFLVTNDNNGLFDVQPTIDPTTGDLTYTPAAGASGMATVTVVLQDDGGTDNGGVDTSAPQMFVITVEPELVVAIDINPHKDPNVVNLKSNGPVDVVVFTTADFNAGDVDVSDLSQIRFGDSSLAEPARVSPTRAVMRDIDHDGDEDLILRFSLKDIKDAGALVDTSTEAELTGLTTDGVPIRGTDSVEIFQPGTKSAAAANVVSKPLSDDAPVESVTGEPGDTGLPAMKTAQTHSSDAVLVGPVVDALVSAELQGSPTWGKADLDDGLLEVLALDQI